MTAEKEKPNENKTPSLILPYYINQGRLLDTYAMLNDGFSEYEIRTLGAESGGQTTKTGNIGFKAVVLGAGFQKDVQSSIISENKHEIKKVQTISSILKYVLDTLESEYMISKKDIKDTKEGDFVVIPVVFKMNSFELAIQKYDSILEVGKQFPGEGVNKNEITRTIKMWDESKKALRNLIPGNEVVCEKDDYVLSSSLDESNLYQSTLSELIDLNLMCLCQIREIENNAPGVRNKLLRDSPLSILNNSEQFLESLEPFKNNGSFSVDLEIMPSTNKPVYGLEIIALYLCSPQPIIGT
ncbi:MAG: hypothetical protein LHW59_08840 [Candidatus Cloacimonetes bacterium]|nr:hypothetical protein [Candidatus Cloacimonadota bacterium]